jgi:hypothetical protein
MTSCRIPILAAAAVMALLAEAHAEPDEYVCVVEHSVGLHFDERSGAWAPQGFAASLSYTLRRLTEDEANRSQYQVVRKYDPQANWAFFRSGDARPLAVCSESDRHFSCKPVVWSLTFDSDSGRFEAALHGAFIAQGHWDQLRKEHPHRAQWMSDHGRGNDPSRPEDLVMQIGKCKPA